jgi:membrane fusion protein (multidrug efflux system)
MVHLDKKKLIGLLLCLGSVAVVAGGWTYAHSGETSTDNAYFAAT